MQQQALQIAIIGGGIGGVAAGLALQKAGLQVTIYEQATQFGEVGAGIQLAPNVTRLLIGLGLAKRLREVAVRPVGVEIRRWHTGDLLTYMPFHSEDTALQEAPHYTIHRADLHAILREQLSPHIMQSHKRCTSIQQADGRVMLTFADGSTTQADVLIGADGIHSFVREQVSHDEAYFSHSSAYRGLIPLERLSDLDFQTHPRIITWFGPQKHFLCYPVSSGHLLNIVGVIACDDWNVESWTEPGRVEDLAQAFAGGDTMLTTILNALDQTMRWALYDRDPLKHWSCGHITLLGDAAHPMLPHMAQGAAQAIEDAVLLAELLQGASRGDIEQRLRQYEEVRQPRASQIQLQARRNGPIFRLPDGEAQQQRDAALRSGALLADTREVLKP